VVNLVATIPGSASTGAVLFAAHYDTMPGSPGAGDNGAAVAVLLETARMVRLGPPLRNDLVFLFTDSEESGLRGVRSFVRHHPRASDVRMVFNFDARGTRGPVLMFETSENNAWLVDGLAAAAPRPFASSPWRDVYRTLPNDTDFSVFRAAGFAGMNFAFVQGDIHYHRATDTPAHLSQETVGHQGSYALGLARHFGDLDMRSARSKANVVYFDLLGRYLVRYPQTWVLPLALLAAATFAALVIAGVRRDRLDLLHIVPAAVVALGVMAGAPLIVLVVVGAATLLGLSPEGHDGDWARRSAFAVLIAMGIGAAAFARCRATFRSQDVVVGALAWWTVITIAAAVWLPGGSHVFTWPLLTLLGPLALSLHASPRPRSAVLAYACALVPTVVIVAGTASQIASAVPLAVFCMCLAPVTLLTALAMPTLDLLQRSARAELSVWSAARR
jgi:hypothetical protein